MAGLLKDLVKGVQKASKTRKKQQLCISLVID
jgi:hypothetical protein